MHHIDLMELDLNLLVTLDVLLDERHVTRAARRIGRSQSATSHALARLRETFEDPLLVPGRGGMTLTPRAEALREPLTHALAQVRGLFALDADFDPAHSTRTFRIGCPDLLGVVFPQLLAELRDRAPHIRVELQGVASDPEKALEQGALDVTLAASSVHEPDTLRGSHVGTLRWMSLVRADHPILSEPVTLDTWTSWPHVQVRTGSSSPSIVGRALEARGVQRRVDTVVPGFMLAAQVVAHTDSVLTTPHLLCDWAREHLCLHVISPPVPLPEVPVRMSWHARWQHDVGHQWFRKTLLEALRACWREVESA